MASHGGPPPGHLLSTGDEGYELKHSTGVDGDDWVERYDALTFPRLSRRLTVRPPRGPWASAWVRVVGPDRASTAPVGMVVIELPEQGESVAQVISLLVEPEHRQRGLAARLVAAAEELARGARAAALELAYCTDWDSRQAVEAVLTAREWSRPETRMVLARGETELARQLLHAPRPHLPDGGEIVAWADLNPTLQTSISAWQRQERWYPEILATFSDEPSLEPAISVALLWHGEPVGWLICHRVAEDTLQYSAFFLRRDLRRQGLGWALLREAVRRRLEDPSLTHAVFAIDARDRRMLDLLATRLRHSVVDTAEIRTRKKRLVD